MHRATGMNNSLVSVATFVGIGGFSAFHTDKNMRRGPGYCYIGTLYSPIHFK